MLKNRANCSVFLIYRISLIPFYGSQLVVIKKNFNTHSFDPTNKAYTFKILKRAVCSVLTLFSSRLLAQFENCASKPLTYQNVLVQATSMEASKKETFDIFSVFKNF
jgi:hypothetical protein